MFLPPPPDSDGPSSPSAAAIASLPFPLRPAPPGPLPPARYEELGINLKHGEPIPPHIVKLPWKSDPSDPEPIRFDLVDRDSISFRNFLANRPPLRRPPPEYEEVPLPLGEGKFVVWSKWGKPIPGLPQISRPFILYPDLPQDYVYPTTITHPLLIRPSTKVYPGVWRQSPLYRKTHPGSYQGPQEISSRKMSRGATLTQPTLLGVDIPRKKRSIVKKCSTNATVGTLL